MDYAGNPAERVEVASLPVLIRTTAQIIVGQMHIRPGRRLKDEMNLGSERYTAITNAKVFEAIECRFLYRAPFLLVAHQHVATITPLADIESAADFAALLRSAEK